MYSPNKSNTRDLSFKFESKPNDIKTRQSRISQNAVSMQSLQFPEISSIKPEVFTIKLQVPESQSNTLIKVGSNNSTTSTNSCLNQRILKKRAKCLSNAITVTNPKQKLQSDEATLMQTIESQHGDSKKYTNVAGWQRSFNESLKAEAATKCVGKCPPYYGEMAKWSKTRQKLFFIENSSKALINNYSKEKKFKELTKTVKYAHNICVDTESELSKDFTCEVINLENPLQLDFQGLDYSSTYQKDEQKLQNQRNYQKACRYMERRKIKAETPRNVEMELHLDMINVPKCFEIRDRSDTAKPVQSESQSKLVKLFRPCDKPTNRILINSENEQRRARYKDLYLQNKARREKEIKSKEINDKMTQKKFPLGLADSNLKKFVKSIDQTIERNIENKICWERNIYEIHKHPYKTQTKQTSVIAREEAPSKTEFSLQHKNNTKDIYSEIFERGSKLTDDEDNMQVGKQQSKFRLRGFQLKKSSNLRGKKLKCKRQEESCIIRNQLSPKKLPTTDDTQQILFPPTFGFKASQAVHSTIKDYRNKPLGFHYNRIKRKNLKFAKPQLRYNVKKFNLINYRFGDTKKRFSLMKDPVADVQHIRPKTANEFVADTILKKKRRQEKLKQMRLKLLGISCEPVKKSCLQSKCEYTSSSIDSGWVPQQEPFFTEEEIHIVSQQIKKELKPFSMRGNMPAPKYREPTLRQHPRYPRDYDNERVPSEEFDHVVSTKNFPFMKKLEKEKIKLANVEMKNRPYANKFEVRHHHDHWIPTQVKQVDVLYQPHLVRPEISKIPSKTDAREMENFHQANPPCNQFVNTNLSLPNYDIENMIRNVKKKVFQSKSNDSAVKNTQYVCPEVDYKMQSRNDKEAKKPDYEGRPDYLQLLGALRKIYKEIITSDSVKNLYVNEIHAVQELEEDLKSIEDCLTSLSSSLCTNFSNDSGSYLLMETKEKIPLDFIRKSVVPFEEMMRSRFQAVPLADVNNEQSNLFQVLPFAGQKKDQLDLTAVKDNFFTFNTRLKNGKSRRLEVPVETVKKKLLGKGLNKHKGVLILDIDENYVKELRNRPSIKLCKFKTGQSFIKDSLRLKFESMIIKSQIVSTKIYDCLCEKHWSDIHTVRKMFEKLFTNWEKREYDAAMTVVYNAKRFLDLTDNLKKEIQQLERELVMLNMDIVFLESHWVRCIMLQNFHYLLGDQDWRLQHDWIHRQDDAPDELENFKDSIAKRTTLNIRKHKDDNAWAIKTFYDQEYSKNEHDNLIVFANGENFLAGLEILKMKTFITLLELHFTLAIHSELQHKLEIFENWCTEDLSEKNQYVSRRCAKLHFITGRAKLLNQSILNFLDEPIEKHYNSKLFHKDRAVIIEAFQSVVPLNLRVSNGHELYTVDMISMLSETVMDILAKFETIHKDLTRQVENKIRARRAYLRKLSFQAYHIKQRIDKEMEKVVKNLTPSYQKIKLAVKLRRYYLKKLEKPAETKVKVTSEHAKFFIRAFATGGYTKRTVDIDGSIIQVDGTQEQIVPFYFDHFLKLNGYTPNYNFKSEIEIRDGLEIDRLQVKSVIPQIQERMEQWETIRRIIMEENIAQNPKMYVDVMT